MSGGESDDEALGSEREVAGGSSEEGTEVSGSEDEGVEETSTGGRSADRALGLVSESEEEERGYVRARGRRRRVERVKVDKCIVVGVSRWSRVSVSGAAGDGSLKMQMNLGRRTRLID